MTDSELDPKVLTLLEKVRIAVAEDRLSDAASFMIEARALIDEKGGGTHEFSLG